MTPERSIPRLRILAAGLCLLALFVLGSIFYLNSNCSLNGWTRTCPESESRELQKLPGLPEQAPPAGVPTSLASDAARAANAAVPFAAIQVSPAQPFRFAGSAQDHSRALQCLALTAMAEAGGSDEGQRAVIQVVLNRVRHPAFPKTVCGVVFQGSERSTGCQFSFTCDGSLARRYSDSAWTAARERADKALFGRVYGKVGTATHYHTDWVFPWWSPQLDKLARVETHLFFRWRGFWGTRAAMNFAYRGGEPDPAALIAGSNRSPTPAEASGSAVEANVADEVPAGGTLTGGNDAGEVVVKHPDGGAFLVLLRTNVTPAAALAYGRRLCGGNGYCRVMGWTAREAIPKGFPIPPASREKLQFSYILDDTNAEVVQYSCARFKGVSADKCIASPPN